MTYDDPRVKQLVVDLEEHLQTIVDRFKETGHDLVLGFAMTDDGGSITGAVATPTLEYTVAARLASEITYYILGNYERESE